MLGGDAVRDNSAKTSNIQCGMFWTRSEIGFSKEQLLSSFELSDDL